jgi:hypothetical protein
MFVALGVDIYFEYEFELLAFLLPSSRPFSAVWVHLRLKTKFKIDNTAEKEVAWPF